MVHARQWSAAPVALVAMVTLLIGAVAGPLAGQAGAARPASDPADVVPGELLVAFDPTLPDAARAALRAHHGLGGAESLPVPGLEVVSLPDHADPVATAARLTNRLGIRYAEPNYVVHATATIPNDPGFDDLWGLHNTGQTGGTPDADIDAPEAWDLAADTSGIVVAVIDTGVDVSHADLAANVWTNSRETPGNGVDDDRNGYVDDVHGWDYLNGDATVYDSGDGDAHGTHVAGTLAAVAGNGRGIVGVSQARIMPLKFLGPDGGNTSDAVRAIDYAIAQGAHVLNNSWGGPSYSQALADAITRADNAGVLVVAAAGNGGEDGIGDDLDSAPLYPAAHTHPNVVSVAATDKFDALTTYSNRGRISVDLAAPGTGIVSTVPGGYASASGSSMSAPHVSGAIAQVQAAFPTLSHVQVRARILDSGDARTSLALTTASGKRLNLAAALSASATVGDGGSGGTTDGGGSGGGTSGGGTGGGSTAPSPGADAEAGETVSTDPAGTTPTVANPVVASITTPVAGPVSLTKSDVVAEVDGHRMVPVGVEITAPEASASDPLVLDLDVAVAALPHGAAASSVDVFRNGAAVPACDVTGATTAAPDPCVSRRSTADGVVSLEVLTSRASTWTLGVPAVSRIAGANRLETAVAASRAGFGDDAARAVVLARADAFPDALAGAGLAVAENGPLLLTPPNDLHDVVADELRRVLAPGGTVHLLGGPAALSAGVADEVRALGLTVVRHAGADRFATAVAIAGATSADPLAVLLTTGDRFPDALTASAAAASAGGVVVLTDGAKLPPATAAYLDAHPAAIRYAIGGPAARAVPDAEAIAGGDRYATAALVADRFFPDAKVAGLATGASFPDALGAGARLGRLGGPLLLAGDVLSGPVSGILSGTERIELYGGTSALSVSLEGTVQALLR